MPLLNAPAFPEAPPQERAPLHGLLATADQPPDDTAGRWTLGMEIEPEDWQEPDAWAGAWCAEDDNDVFDDAGKQERTIPGLVVVAPWQHYTSYRCTFGRTQQERVDKVRRMLDAGLSKAVERELWTGATRTAANGGDPVQALAYQGDLADAAADLGVTIVRNPGYTVGDAVSTVAPVSLEVGIGLLSQALADYGPGTLGMIHMTALAGDLATRSGQVVEDGRGGASTLRTKGRGDLVVVGSGYPGTGPGGDEPDDFPVVQWVHASKIVQVRRGLPDRDETLAESLNRATNRWTVRTEIPVAAWWASFFQASVLVDLSADTVLWGDPA